VSPVFRHGRLRLYLLKLLDEAPRHGYEVIRLLQDRFLGVYAPSPGTIYPRLARLEEDGLVTHEEVDGKKIYSITDKGREEIRTRLGELADLEDELTESLRDVAREISEDVRDTVRSIREEFASAAREFRNQEEGERQPADAPDAAAGSDAAGGSDEARRIRQEARQNREQMRAAFRGRARTRGEWAAWQEKVGRPDWAGWTSRSDWSSAADEPPSGTAGPSESEQGQRQAGASGGRARSGPPGPFSDLERMALQFATELRAAARQAGDLGDRSLNDLRDILTDTLAKVRVEVFTDEAAQTADPAAGTKERADAPEAAQTADADKASKAAETAPTDADGEES
jgi:DNA-binding PadR family transcriptional regulator